MREMFVGSYRVIYRYVRPTVEILTVRHGAMQQLGEEDVFSE
jgi:plasmid stabilization system protein ParE